MPFIHNNYSDQQHQGTYHVNILNLSQLLLQHQVSEFSDGSNALAYHISVTETTTSCLICAGGFHRLLPSKPFNVISLHCTHISLNVLLQTVLSHLRIKKSTAVLQTSCSRWLSPPPVVFGQFKRCRRQFHSLRRQRHWEAARASRDSGGANGAALDPLTGMAALASDLPPLLLDLYDEDWCEALIGLEAVEAELGLEVPAPELVPSSSETVTPDLEILPGGIPVHDLTNFLKDKGSFSLEQQAEIAHKKFGCLPYDPPHLLLAVQIVRAVRHTLAFELLESLSETVQREPSGTLSVTTLGSELCVMPSHGGASVRRICQLNTDADATDDSCR